MKVAAVVLACALSVPLRAQPLDTLRAVPVDGLTFLDARALSVDPFGTMYVVDAGRDAVVIRSATGEITILGGPGSREGEFDAPAGVDPTNGLVILVADAGNHRIQRFSRSLAFLGSVPLGRFDDRAVHVTYQRGQEGAADLASGKPIAVASTEANEMFAIDADRNVVVKWDAVRRVRHVIGGVNAGPGSLLEPVSLAVDGESLLYVADRGRAAVVVFDAYGTFVRMLGEGRLSDVRAVATRDRRVYVALPDAVFVYGDEGRLLHSPALDLAAPLVDLAAAPGGRLFALARTAVYELVSPPSR